MMPHEGPKVPEWPGWGQPEYIYCELRSATRGMERGEINERLTIYSHLQKLGRITVATDPNNIFIDLLILSPRIAENKIYW